MWLFITETETESPPLWQKTHSFDTLMSFIIPSLPGWILNLHVPHISTAPKPLGDFYFQRDVLPQKGPLHGYMPPFIKVHLCSRLPWPDTLLSVPSSRWCRHRGGFLSPIPVIPQLLSPHPGYFFLVLRRGLQRILLPNDAASLLVNKY